MCRNSGVFGAREIQMTSKCACARLCSSLMRKRAPRPKGPRREEQAPRLQYVSTAACSVSTPDIEAQGPIEAGVRGARCPSLARCSHARPAAAAFQNAKHRKLSCSIASTLRLSHTRSLVQTAPWGACIVVACRPGHKRVIPGRCWLSRNHVPGPLHCRCLARPASLARVLLCFSNYRL